jgi:hypothetical protein
MTYSMTWLRAVSLATFVISIVIAFSPRNLTTTESTIAYTLFASVSLVAIETDNRLQKLEKKDA